MCREMSLLFAVALLCGLLGAGESTTCTATTKKTCEKSLFMTGVCTGGKCACVSSDYEAGPFGCQKRQQTAEVTSYFVTTIQTGSTTRLMCSPSGLVSDSYKWYKDDVEVNAETAQGFDFSSAAAGDSAAYSCKSSVSGILTDESKDFPVNVEMSPTTPPVVTGMPTAVGDDMKVKFECTSTVFWNSPTYSWEVNSVPVDGATSSDYTHTVVVGNAGQELKCSIGIVVSSAVTFPDPLATTLTGVQVVPLSSLKLQKGEMLGLSCKLTGGFPDHVTGDTTIDYKWKKDGEDIAAETATTYVKNEVDVSDSGSYTCLATFGGEVESAAVVVEVVDTMEGFTISKSAEGFLEDGYYSLTCEYKAVNTLLPVTYLWRKANKELLGVTDKTLQFNAVGDDSVDGRYDCKVTGEQGSVWSKTVEIEAKASTEIGDDTPTISLDSSKKGVGDTYVFSCYGDYNTPGVMYTWTKDGTAEDPTESGTYEFTPTTSDAVEFKCKYSFDGEDSGEATKTITPGYILEKTITVNGFAVTGTLKPVEESKVQLTCEVTKSGGAGTVAYQWKTDGTDVEGQTSKNYEHTVGAAGTAPVVKCEVTVNEVTEETDDVTITAQDPTDATVDKPKVVMGGNAKIGADVSLYCISVSYVEGATFQWQKGDDVIPGATSYLYEIKSLADSHQGDYKCKVTVGAVASDLSDAKTVTPAIQCTWASDCDGANMDTTACEKNKCKCLSGYTMNNFQCSGSSTLAASLLLLVWTAIARQMF